MFQIPWFDGDYVPKANTGRSLAAGELSLADELDFDFSLPDEVPDYFQNILLNYPHAKEKKKR